MDWTHRYLKNHQNALEKISTTELFELVHLLCSTLKTNNTIYVIGNGGSAANASHFVEDLVKGANDSIQNNSFYNNVQEIYSIKVPEFKAISLCDSVPFITAIGNDYCFEDIYLRQLKPLGQFGDVLLGLSVSGTSPNLVKAFKWAQNNKLKTASITGLQSRDKVDSIYALSNLAINIQSTHYGIVEDCTMTILHLICYYIMEKMNA